MRTLLFLCLLPLHLAAAELQPFSLEYELTRNDMVLGKVKMTLAIKGDSYDFRSESKTSGLAAMLSGDQILEQSQGRLLPNGGIEPHNYSYRHTQGKKTKEDTKISFIPGKNQAKVERLEAAPQTLEIPAQTQDQLSAQLLLMRALDKTSVAMTMLDGKKLHSYQFQAKGMETIKVPAGSFKTKGFSRQEAGKPSIYNTWFSMGPKPVPVLVQQQKKPKEATFSLRLVSKP